MSNIRIFVSRNNLLTSRISFIGHYSTNCYAAKKLIVYILIAMHIASRGLRSQTRNSLKSSLNIAITFIRVQKAVQAPFKEAP